MNFNRTLAAAAALALVLCTAPAISGVETADATKVLAGNYELDPSHAAVAARIDHLGFSKTTIRFSKISGKLAYDPQHPESANLDVTIDAASLNSDWKARDDELRSPAFFNVPAHPTIRYVATSLQRIDGSHAKVNGQLTLLGVTKPVQMDVTLLGSGTGMMNDRRIGFAATMRINRSDFGMKAFLPAVGDAVDILIDAEFSKK